MQEQTGSYEDTKIDSPGRQLYKLMNDSDQTSTDIIVQYRHNNNYMY